MPRAPPSIAAGGRRGGLRENRPPCREASRRGARAPRTRRRAAGPSARRRGCESRYPCRIRRCRAGGSARAEEAAGRSRCPRGDMGSGPAREARSGDEWRRAPTSARARHRTRAQLRILGRGASASCRARNRPRCRRRRSRARHLESRRSRTRSSRRARTGPSPARRTPSRPAPCLREGSRRRCPRCSRSGRERGGARDGRGLPPGEDRERARDDGGEASDFRIVARTRLKIGACTAKARVTVGSTSAREASQNRSPRPARSVSMSRSPVEAGGASESGRRPIGGGTHSRR